MALTSPPFSFTERHHVLAALTVLATLVLLGVAVGGIVGQAVAQLVGLATHAVVG